MKVIYLVLDGLGDRPIKEMSYKTPLEAANKPNWDSLARNSLLGLHWAVKRNFAPESDAATLALLGYDPFNYYTGRGPLEAFGAGLKIEKGEIVARCNFAFEESGYLKEVEAKISDDVAKELCKKLNSEIKEIDGVQTKIFHTKGYRAVLILRGKNLGLEIEGNHPGYALFKGFVSRALPSRGGKIKLCKALNKKSERAAKIVNKWLLAANGVLKVHSPSTANTILLRGFGNKIPKLPKRTGWAAIAGMPAERAIAKFAGMALCFPKKNLVGQIENLLKKHLAVYVHIKDPDSISHSGNFIGKKEFFENFDLFFKELCSSKVLSECAICVTGDHSTPCSLRAHSGDPVPVLLHIPGKKGDLLNFSEKECKNGSLGYLTGLKLFNKINQLIKHGK